MGRARTASSATPAAALLARLAALCRALPQSTAQVRGDHADFRVRQRVYAYFLDNHHGDGIISVCVKTRLGEHVDRVRLEPQRCYLPAYIGKRGWLGVRLDLGRVDWREVEELVRMSYRHVAPRTLVARLDSAVQPPAVRRQARGRTTGPAP